MVNERGGLQEGKITAATMLSCPPYLNVNGWIYHNWASYSLGQMNVAKALATSCDTFFYQVAAMVGDVKVVKFAGAFGFGRTKRIEMPGVMPGLVPDRIWKQLQCGVPDLTSDTCRWNTGATITFGIGQSYLVTPPLNQAVYDAALASGGQVMRPTLVDEVRDASGHEIQTLHPQVTGTVPASANNLMTVREGMREEINRPYNMNYWFRAAGVPADGGGKTGTAQWGGSGLDLPTHAWFVFFAPYAQPEVALSIFVERGELSEVEAAPIGVPVMKFYPDHVGAPWAFGVVQAPVRRGAGRLSQPKRSGFVAIVRTHPRAGRATGGPDPDPAGPGHHDRLRRGALRCAVPRESARVAPFLPRLRGRCRAAPAALPAPRLPAQASRDLSRPEPGPPRRRLQPAAGADRGRCGRPVRPGMAPRAAGPAGFRARTGDRLRLRDLRRGVRLVRKPGSAGGFRLAADPRPASGGGGTGPVRRAARGRGVRDDPGPGGRERWNEHRPAADRGHSTAADLVRGIGDDHDVGGARPGPVRVAAAPGGRPWGRCPWYNHSPCPSLMQRCRPSWSAAGSSTASPPATRSWSTA